MGVLIVVEGPDNSGKSTLAERIAHRFGFRVQESEGPPTEGETIDQRIRRYSHEDSRTSQPTVYARHPVVSQPIYASIKGNRGDRIDPVLTEQFYALKPILVYCDPLNRGLSDHKLKPHDSAEFIADLNLKHLAVREKYRTWAAERADVVWRIGDDEERMMELVTGLLRYAARSGASKRMPRASFPTF